ncbi:MAG: hypothetical protein NXI13_16475 [Proteobacteria bacterium]|nr:hypothetical protein [Pseudomonadota bacterium]
MTKYELIADLVSIATVEVVDFVLTMEELKKEGELSEAEVNAKFEQRRQKMVSRQESSRAKFDAAIEVNQG